MNQGEEWHEQSSIGNERSANEQAEVLFVTSQFLIRMLPWDGKTPKYKIISDHEDLKNICVFPKIGVGPQNGWFIMETLLKWMIWRENPLFSETSIS